MLCSAPSGEFCGWAGDAVIPYVSTRDGRFEYASDAIEAVEDRNCRLGCVRGAQSELEALEIGGWGGFCSVLVEVALGRGNVVDQVEDRGDELFCLVREPR